MRNSIAFTAVTAALLGYSLISQAAFAKVSLDRSSRIARQSSHFTLGVVERFHEYKSNGRGPARYTEHGWLPGLHAGLTLMLNIGALHHIYLQGSGGIAHGLDAFSGYTRSGATVHKNDSAAMNQTWRYQVKTGEGFQLGRHWMVIPYATFGQRYVIRKVHALNIYETGGPISPRDYYMMKYIGAGLRVVYTASPNLTVDADVMGAGMLDPHMHTYTNGAHPMPWAHFGIGYRAMGRVTLGADYRLRGPWHVYANLGYTHIEYVRTNWRHYGSGRVQLPSAHLEDLQVGVGLRYNF